MWYYDGAWDTVADTTWTFTNTASDISANIPALRGDNWGYETLKFMGYFNSNGAQSTELDSVTLGYTNNAVRLVSPNGYETLYVNESTNITWETVGVAMPNLKIQYSKSNFVSDTTVLLDTTGFSNTTWIWQIPNNSSLASSTAKIRITNKDTTSIWNQSDNYFTVANVPITLTSWSLNMNAHQLTLVFNENMSVSTLDVTKITIQII